MAENRLMQRQVPWAFTLVALGALAGCSPKQVVTAPVQAVGAVARTAAPAAAGVAVGAVTANPAAGLAAGRAVSGASASRTETAAETPPLAEREAPR